MREDQKIFGEGGGGEHIAAFAKDRYIFFIYIYIYIYCGHGHVTPLGMVF